MMAGGENFFMTGRQRRNPEGVIPDHIARKKELKERGLKEFRLGGYVIHATSYKEAQKIYLEMKKG